LAIRLVALLGSKAVSILRPKTQCEQHRDSLQRGDGSPPVGAHVPQCDDQGQYRPQQCHGSTGHCWCVDSRGQERQGTRTPPGSPRFNCDAPGKYTTHKVGIG
uniref:Thyroglobulin type-1 domain-containing protein n=1 Tax=Astyanax mexicanus TaxID=7994 RepID=A0A3B1IWF4_ASTMX